MEVIGKTEASVNQLTITLASESISVVLNSFLISVNILKKLPSLVSTLLADEALTK
jgi:hypothetical protein